MNSDKEKVYATKTQAFWVEEIYSIRPLQYRICKIIRLQTFRNENEHYNVRMVSLNKIAKIIIFFLKD